MKLFFKLLIFIIFSLFLHNCKNLQKDDEKKLTLQEEINIQARLKNFERFEQEFNDDSTYVIIEESVKPDNLNPYPTRKFFIYSIADNKVIYEDSIPGGEIYWLDSENVVIKTVPRQEKIDKMIENVKIYNISNKDFK